MRIAVVAGADTAVGKTVVTARRRADRPASSLQDLAQRAVGTLADRDLVLIEGTGRSLVHPDAAAGRLADLAARLVIGDWLALPDLAAMCNLDHLNYTGRPVFGRLAEIAGRLAPPGSLEIARAGLVSVAPARLEVYA